MGIGRWPVLIVALDGVLDVMFSSGEFIRLAQLGDRLVQAASLMEINMPRTRSPNR